MEETQEERPDSEEYLERVGIEGLKSLVKTGSGDEVYKFVSTFDVFIDLPKEKRGIHMSRLVESISEVVTEKSAYRYGSFEELEREIIRSLQGKHRFERAEVSLFSELVVKKKTPVSKRESMETHDINVRVVYDKGGWKKVLRVGVVGSTACPHSKRNTGHPHIQRATAELEVECDFDVMVDLNRMVECVEAEFSSEVYSLVKTVDENYIVRRMYERPRFVEDVTRGILSSAKRMFPQCNIRVKTVSQESIHRHNAVAEGSYTAV